MDISNNKVDFCLDLIDYNINNKKGDTCSERFIDIMSDPNNLYIKRHSDSGKIVDNYVILHNGTKVLTYGYYDEFSKILQLNYGCHEPAEERIFDMVLKFIPDNAVMIELGSYWAFYTIWFNTVIKNAINYCIEPSLSGLELGKINCKLNNINNVDFTNGFIGNNKLRVSEFVKYKNISFIDILHCDIQGYEYEMLCDIRDILNNKLIRYLFISTHSQDIHNNCVNLIQSCNYRIIANADFDNETFCMDGIIVACHKTNLDIPFTKLGARKHTPLRKNPFPISYYN